MATCVPIRDMKDTAKFTELIESAAEPVTVTRNGYDAFVVMRSSEYESLMQEVAKAQLLSRMAIADAEFEAGDYVDGAAFTAQVRDRYGI